MIVSERDETYRVGPDLPFGYGGSACTGEPSSTLRFYDPDTLQETLEVAAPSCLVSMKDAPGDGFFGLFGKRRPFSVGRFDGQGNLTATASVTPRFVLRRARGDRVVDLVVRGDQLVALITAFDDDDQGEPRKDWELHVFRAHDLSLVDVIEASNIDTFGAIRPTTMSTAAGGLIALGANRPSAHEPAAIVFVDIERRAVTTVDIQRISSSLLDLLAYGDSVLLALGGTISGVRSVRQGDPAVAPSAVVLDRDAAPTALAPWPGSNRVLVAATDFLGRDFPIPVLALYEDGDAGRGGRFLAQSRLLADERGPIRNLVTDGRRVFGLLPWSGRIIRITPR